MRIGTVVLKARLKYVTAPVPFLHNMLEGTPV